VLQPEATALFDEVKAPPGFAELKPPPGFADNADLSPGTLHSLATSCTDCSIELDVFREHKPLSRQLHCLRAWWRPLVSEHISYRAISGNVKESG